MGCRVSCIWIGIVLLFFSIWSGRGRSRSRLMDCRKIYWVTMLRRGRGHRFLHLVISELWKLVMPLTMHSSEQAIFLSIGTWRCLSRFTRLLDDIHQEFPELFILIFCWWGFILYTRCSHLVWRRNIADSVWENLRDRFLTRSKNHLGIIRLLSHHPFPVIYISLPILQLHPAVSALCYRWQGHSIYLPHFWPCTLRCSKI